ncbi:transposase [Bradyrhizobium sp. Pear77]|nr:hypothetical protein [Bradyrhizobium altum]MCC8955786.1 transposase [Bradyrhizobium altum]
MVAMEACASAHYWGREIGKFGHDIRLIHPSYVKPIVKHQKNDAPDAEAIAEAASRPTMRFVGVKSAEKQLPWRSRFVISWFDSVHRRLTPCAGILRNTG